MRSILIVNILTVLTMIAGFASNILLAAIFGLTYQVDAYFAAVVIPTLVSTLYVSYIGKTFLPIYSQLREDGSEKIDEFVSTIINVVGIGAILIIVLLAVFSTPILRLILPGFDQETLSSSREMLLIMSPTIFFVSINNFHGYLWQYEGKYYRVVVENFLLPTCIMISIFLGHEVIKEMSLSTGYLAGRAIGFLLLLVGTRYTYKFVMNFSIPQVRSVFGSSSILLGTGFIARMQPLIEKSIASTVGEGSVSALAMGNKLCNPIYQGATIGVRMLAFAKSSKLVAKGQLDRAGELTNIVTRLLLMVIVPIATLLFVYASEITEVIFVRGGFTAAMHGMVEVALLGLAPTIVFLSISPIMSNLLFSLKNIKAQAWLGPISTLVYFLAAVQLSKDYGLLGVALALSISTCTRFLVLGFFAQKHVAVFNFKGLLFNLTLYSSASWLIFYGAKTYIYTYNLLSIYELIIVSTVGSVCYLLFLFVLKDKSLTLLWNMVVKRNKNVLDNI